MLDWDPLQNNTIAVESMSPQCSYRMKRDLTDLYNDPLEGILIEPDESHFLRLHVLITGPEGTPYEKGFFYFVVGFPSNYPFSSPKVRLMTTGGGTVRFNPNLYASGKVCLSILGTFPGPQWTAALGIRSVLLSIQALLNSTPYTNEPGFEKERNTGDFKKYNDMVTYETLRIAVLGMAQKDSTLCMPQTFTSFIQQQFLHNYSFYEKVILENIPLSGHQIDDPLYHSINGAYEYDKLLDKLESVKEMLLQ